MSTEYIWRTNKSHIHSFQQIWKDLICGIWSKRNTSTLKKGNAIPPLPHTSSWHSAYLIKRRKKFTFYSKWNSSVQTFRSHFKERVFSKLPLVAKRICVSFHSPSFQSDVLYRCKGEWRRV
jgi:hypothetical protein